MSAIAALIEKQRVHLISDTAATHRGRLMGHCVKTFPIPHLGVAISIRGNTKSARTIAHLIGEYDDQDEMRAQIPLRLRALGGILTKLWPMRYGFDCIIAGINHGKPFAWLISSKTGYEFSDVEYFVAAPADPDMSEELSEAVDGFDGDTRGGTTRLDAAACRLLDLQRQKFPGCIGGFGQITTVTQGGIFTRTVKRWPDKLGHKLAEVA